MSSIQNSKIVEVTVCPLLQVRNLQTSLFTGEGEMKVVDDLSFDLERNQTLAIVGESGCGKSMMALSLMGLVPEPPGRVVSGQVKFNGRDLLKLSELELQGIRGNDISMIFQEPMTSLNPVLSIGRQLTETLELHLKMSKQQAMRRASELLAMVGIPDPDRRLKDYPHQLSGGMRQRVMIAMAISCNPRLLIADEPTTALDVTIQAEIMALILRLCRENRVGLILITHDLGVVAEVTARLMSMYAGQVVEEGPTRQIIDHPGHPYSRGLLAALPQRVERGQALNQIPGTMPGIADLPAGCAYHPRCEPAYAGCHVEIPQLEAHGSRRISCFRPLLAGAET